MQCPTCRTGQLDDIGRCPVCGPAQPNVRRVCANCSFENDAKARFCGGCGRPVITLAGAAKSAVAYVHSPIPKSMATRLERSGSAMLGERKRVTILFADIRGSTEMVDRLEVDGALEILAPLLRSMMDAVHQYDGFVNRTIGDGIMALFGAPLANEDHAVLACQAAIAMRSKVQDVANEIGEKVELRIGLHTGDVLIHSIGHDLAMSFDAIGKAVHIAARLEAGAPPGTIRISAETHAMARHCIEAKPAGRLSLKGIEEVVESFDLIRSLPATRWQTRRISGLVPIIGRKLELDALNACREEAGAGRAQLVTVVGNPGLGKSRLLHEFVSTLPKDWIIFEISGLPNFVHSPHSALAGILRQVLNLAIDEETESARQKLSVVLQRLGAAASSFEPLAAIVCGVKAVPGWLAADPQEQSARLKAAIADITLCQVRLAPLCLIVEDLQWIDAESIAILGALRLLLDNQRLIIVTSEREPGRVSDTMAATSRIRIESLRDEDSARLVDQHMGDHPSLLQIKRQIREQGAGNPLFIEELVQSLSDAKEIEGQAGNYVAGSVIRSLHLPASVKDVLAARIDRLEASQKAVLQTASVIGAELPYWMLARLMPPDQGGLEADIENLSRAGFLFRTASGLEAKYNFKHDLARETVYDMIPRATRRRLHARAVSIIEEEFKDRIDDHADALAYHAASAELWEKALPYQLRSARRAARRGANRDCIAIVDLALRALQGLPDIDDVNRAKIDFRLLLVTALEPLGLHERAREQLVEALAIAEVLADERRIAAVQCQLALAWWRRGEHGKARLAAEAALGLAVRLGDGPLIFAARHNLGIIGHQTGKFESAIAHLSFCNTLMSAQQDERRFGWAAYPSVILRTFLSDCLVEVGRIEDARTVAVAAVDTAINSGHLYSIVQINQVRARIHLAQGEIEAAEKLMAETWKSVIDNELLQLLPIMATRYGEALVHSGKLEMALTILQQPEAFPSGEKSNTYGWGQLYCAQAAALHALDRNEEARDCAERALQYSAERGELPQVAYARYMLAEIDEEETGSISLTNTHRVEAARLAEACGMAGLLARVTRNEAGSQ